MTEYDDGRVIDKDELLQEALNFIDYLHSNLQLIAYGTINEQQFAEDLDKEIQEWKDRIVI